MKSMLTILVLSLTLMVCKGDDERKTEPDGPPVRLTEKQKDKPICLDRCGDHICAEVVCMGAGCPCPETPESCPADCQK